MIEKNQYEYAIFLITECIKNNFQKPEALIRRATCYMHMHRYREAIKDLGNAIELNRTIPSAYIKQSKCYVAIGDLQNAINMIAFLSQIEQNNSYAQIELQHLEKLKALNKEADQLFERKQYRDVVVIMDKCLEKAEICVKFKLMKAECLVYLGKYDEALNSVNEVLFTNKDDLEAICIRALNLMHQKKYILGLAELKEIMPLSPRAKIMYRNYKRIIECLKLANIEFENNKLLEAEQLYREALNLDNRNEHKNRQILLKLAQILLKQKEFEKCIDMTCDILEYDPDNIKALEFRAKCNIELKEYDLAIEDYKKILKLGGASNPQEIQRNINIAEKKAKDEYDNYKFMNLSRHNITAAAIKKAYHNLARIYHPDKSTITSEYVKHKLNIKFTRLTKAKNELLILHG